MSSTLYLINWGPDVVTPTLNQGRLSSIQASRPGYDFYPFRITTPRDASGPGQPGEWGRVNTLVVQPAGGGSQIFNDLPDPQGAEPNTTLFLWIFPQFLVFSQSDWQLGSPVYPGAASL